MSLLIYVINLCRVSWVLKGSVSLRSCSCIGIEPGTKLFSFPLLFGNALAMPMWKLTVYSLSFQLLLNSVMWLSKEAVHFLCTA